MIITGDKATIDALGIRCYSENKPSFWDVTYVTSSYFCAEYSETNERYESVVPDEYSTWLQSQPEYGQLTVL